MPTSLNGWPVLDAPPWGDKRLVRKQVPGTPASLWMRGSVLPLFLALSKDYHDTIHPLTVGSDTDGYDYRQARTGAGWSDHSSGTGEDIRASAEGAQGPGERSWWVGEKAAAARVIKARYQVVIWGGDKALGGDYQQAKWWDWMHWALRPGVTQVQVNAVIKALGISADGVRTKGAGPIRTPSRHMLHLMHLVHIGTASRHERHAVHVWNSTGVEIP
jgi:hypothetical protein